MSETRSYYRSNHANVLAFWRETERLNDAFASAAIAFEAEYPTHKIVISKWSDGRKRGYGLEGEKPGDEWQQKRGEKCWTPKRATAAGKRIAKRLDAIFFAVPEIPGTAQWIFDFPSSGTPGIAEAQGFIWMTWSFSHEVVEREPRFNADIWKRAKASEYWAAIEARETERKSA